MESSTGARVVWDMDGTLLDTTMVVPGAFVAALLELGGPAVDRDDVVSAYSMGVPEVILEHFLGRRLRRGEEESYYRLLGQVRVAPYDGVVDCMHALRAAGHLISVFTGASTRAARSLLSAAGLDVDVLVGGDQVEHPKPAGDGLVEVARRLHARPAALFYLGDAPTDLLAAKAAGARSVAVAWGHLYRPDAPADHTLHRPLDALRLLDAR